MTYTIDEKGLIQGDNIKHILCNKHSGKFASSHPDTILLHYTDGSTLDGAVSHLSNPDVNASAHIVIGRDGEIVQLVPFLYVAWHAGESSFQDRSGFNKYSIGIEMVNAGPLRQVGSQYISSFGKKYNQDEVLKDTHRNENEPRYWHIYTEKQIAVVTSICKILINYFNIQMILGHEEVAPIRKTDPGPAFPLDLLRNQLLESRFDENDNIYSSKAKEKEIGSGLVTATKLNMRERPSVYSKKIREPLQQSQDFKILQEQSGWYKIRINDVGWVKKEYVKRIDT